MEYDINKMYNLYEPKDFYLKSTHPSGITRLSKSSVRTYMECPYRYYLKYVQKVIKLKPITDYPRLCGVMVHRFAAGLHKKHKHSGRFYYKTVKSAVSTWFYLWAKTLIENDQILLKVDNNKADMFGGVGANCIKNYWEVSYDKPDPVIIEKKYTIPWSPGFEFTGVFDQVRPVSIDIIKNKRPNLIENDKLDVRYNPVVIIDLKTGYYDYEVVPDSTEEEKIRHQYDLQRDIQAAAYTLLYKAHNHGKLPLYFAIHQLKNNKFFTVIGEGDETQEILKSSINHVIQGIKTGSFPKNIGPNCRRCDYTTTCLGDNPISISLPDGTLDTNLYPPNKEEVKEYKQLKLKLKPKNKPAD
ncbi:PD-(D/E)XK nuclease family protein [Patescibacteria group bacterium]|nr:PD-(D/E)XK nuclease family protein [Patescibacteria group bacterium]